MDLSGASPEYSTDQVEEYLKIYGELREGDAFIRNCGDKAAKKVRALNLLKDIIPAYKSKVPDPLRSRAGFSEENMINLERRCEEILLDQDPFE